MDFFRGRFAIYPKFYRKKQSLFDGEKLDFFSNKLPDSRGFET